MVDDIYVSVQVVDDIYVSVQVVDNLSVQVVDNCSVQVVDIPVISYFPANSDEEWEDFRFYGLRRDYCYIYAKYLYWIP